MRKKCNCEVTESFVLKIAWGVDYVQPVRTEQEKKPEHNEPVPQHGHEEKYLIIVGKYYPIFPTGSEGDKAKRYKR